MTPTAARILEASAALIELEVTIEAPAERVWDAIVERPDAWWISELRCVGDSTVEFEPHAGGRFLERNEDGASLLWFTVISIEPQRAVNFAGDIAPPFGGPCQAFLNIALEERDGATVVRMTNSMHGHVDEAMLPEVEGGWRMLLENGLKRFVETGARA